MKNPLATFTAFMLFALGLNSPSFASAPKIVVSITPFYGLVAAIMKGVGSPELLVKPGASPHQYVLRPKEIKWLKEADIIFWAGPELETFLTKPLNNLAQETKSTTIIQLDQIPGLLRLPLRQDPAWDPHDHSHHHTGAFDMHFWLDPKNALFIAEAITKNLLIKDPTRTAIYLANLKELKKRLNHLHVKLEEKLKPIKKQPFIVFHDAYQYFEHRYQLNGVGAISLHPEIPPSAKRLYTIRSIIIKTKAKCLFTEPQFQPKLIQNIAEDLHVKTGELDPIGNPAEKTEEGYFLLLDELADSLYTCLKE